MNYKPLNIFFMIHTKDLYMEDLQDQSCDPEYEAEARQAADYAEHMNIQHELAEFHLLVPPIDLGLMQPSVATSEQIAHGIIEAVKEGRISPIELAVKKKCIEQAFELVYKDEETKKLIISEVDKYGKEGATLYGATVKVTSTGKYEYAKDKKWAELTESIAETMVKIKAQEELVKMATKAGKAFVDEESGEITASPVPCPKTETVAVSFKKK